MKVNTEGLLEQANQLNSVIDRMIGLEQCLRRVEHRLLGVSDLERLCPAVERQRAQITRQTLDLIHLQQALNEIARRYTVNETALSDRAGQNQVIYRRLPTGYIQLPKLWPDGTHHSGLLDMRPWRRRSRGLVGWNNIVKGIAQPRRFGSVVVRWAEMAAAEGVRE